MHIKSIQKSTGNIAFIKGLELIQITNIKHGTHTKSNF